LHPRDRRHLWQVTLTTRPGVGCAGARASICRSFRPLNIVLQDRRPF
jgi:hypothetical protein